MKLCDSQYIYFCIYLESKFEEIAVYRVAALVWSQSGLKAQASKYIWSYISACTAVGSVERLKFLILLTLWQIEIAKSKPKSSCYKNRMWNGRNIYLMQGARASGAQIKS